MEFLTRVGVGGGSASRLWTLVIAGLLYIVSFASAEDLECVPDKKPCKVDGSLGGWCCSDFCFVSGANKNNTGFCREYNCIEDGDSCHRTGSIGFCCTGYCDQNADEPTGVCGFRIESTTQRPGPGSSSNSDDEGIGRLDTSQILGVSFGSLTIVLLACILIGLWIFRRQRLVLTEKDIKSFLNGLPNEYQTSTVNTESTGTGTETTTGPPAAIDGLVNYLVMGPYKQEYEISEKDFTIDNSALLGSGEFSIVMKGFVHGDQVAVKTVRNRLKDIIYLKALLTELKILIYIGSHPNIVSLVGANTSCLHKGSCYVFVELCPNGSLESYLRSHRNEFMPIPTLPTNNDSIMSSRSQDVVVQVQPKPLPYVQLDDNQNQNIHQDFKTLPTASIMLLIKWASEIATGMSYLSDLKVVHGDLAIRNVLLGESLVAKISDFGLSKKLYNYAKFKCSNDVPLPWRNMAPESLSHLTFSTKSDIWSFGITLWEIFSIGDVPYAGLNWSDQFLNCLNHSMRPQKPIAASDEMYLVMLDCWVLEPDMRPSFCDLMTRISALKMV